MAEPLTDISPMPMDAECVKLCDALNGMPGIMTIDSCCGHGERPFFVTFAAASMDALRSVVEKIDKTNWRIEALFKRDTGLLFKLIGGIGKSAYEEAQDLIRKIETDFI